MKPGDHNPKIRYVLQLYDVINPNERIIVDVLRHVIATHLPAHCKEKWLTMFRSFMVTKVFV